MCHDSPSTSKRHAFPENCSQHFHENTAIDEQSGKFTDVTGIIFCAIESAPHCKHVLMYMSVHEHRHACIHVCTSLRGCVLAIHAWHFNEIPFASPFRTLVLFTLRTLVGPLRSPLTSTGAQHAVPPSTFPTSHAPTRSILPSTLHSCPPLGLPPTALSENPAAHLVCLPTWICVTCHPSIPPFFPQHIHEVRGKQRPLLVVKLGDAVKQTVSLSVKDSCRICSQTTESLQVERHPLAHDWLQLASKFDSAKTRHKHF